MTRRVVFLPGAGGAPEFWRPVGALLPDSWEKEFLAWPGLGSQPASPDVRGFDDLVRLGRNRLTKPSAVVAQSMGGVVALRLALACPDLVERLVLVATSGGLDVAALGAASRQDDYAREFPDAAPWIRDPVPDLTAELAAIAAPTLLLWGDADTVSPVAIGEQLRELIPRASLAVLPGAGHDLAVTRADEAAALVLEHLGS